ncbi:hypothetical protein QAD02_004584 [Eretmocerus hayati]|uniref:Uncharacterized protein n=1 Tax=Eretmocerus hayati TaxID=131215 RepID=A0ACC2NQE2_9HYME|nr:hypothetical protein QAD02_004584 [Eretmocerus hayati]
MDFSSKVPMRKVKVKNKAPSDVQITAEQLLQDAHQHSSRMVPQHFKQKISDPYELADYQHRERKKFEDSIRRNRLSIPTWIKYALWEEGQKQIDRARSIFERALDIDYKNVVLWLKYTEMEMRNKQVNHARNLWDRAVTICPRVNQFWYKYTYMEEMLENIAGARQVFERWMEWEPHEQAWQTYINFEFRYKELDRVRQIYERLITVHPTIKNWIKYAKFEKSSGCISSARSIFERAVEFFSENEDDLLFIAFATFEEDQREYDRARVIYKYALEHLPKNKTEQILKAFTKFEKKFGDSCGAESAIISKRVQQYEQELQDNPFNYDVWFDYLKAIENKENIETIRETYEKAVANIPPVKEKETWRRYIYLWINYAFFEELVTEDVERTRQVYKICLEIIPHKNFTFSKIWLYYAQFEIRQKNVASARKILGNALGVCPKRKLYQGYIDIEIQLREFDRCRILYEKFLEFCPQDCTTWVKFAEFEAFLGETKRAEAVYELGISHHRVDMPEVVWKSYLDYLTSEQETEKVRNLYERLLKKSKHPKIWIAFANFELTNSTVEEVSKRITAARNIYERGCESLRSNGDNGGRALLLESWKNFEVEHGDEDSIAGVTARMPRRVKRRQQVLVGPDDHEWREVFEIIFPEDEQKNSNEKILAAARNWNERMAEIQLKKTSEKGDETLAETDINE